MRFVNHAEAGSELRNHDRPAFAVRIARSALERHQLAGVLLGRQQAAQFLPVGAQAPYKLKTVERPKIHASLELARQDRVFAQNRQRNRRLAQLTDEVLKSL